jgi:uncharacterized protein involved in exopolysaccharide biosynthesis
MAKKSKEIEVGGLRIQIDPLILVRRILMRQKLLLCIIALLGGIATIGLYLRTPKKYTSFAEIVIRAESFQEDYLRKLLNVVARYIGSDTEMMIIINELNLYASSRASLPYDIALRDMRRELKIDRPGGSIVISFQSKNPVEAQRVVAFVTERLMTKLTDLKDSPYKQQLDAINTGITEVSPRLRDAQLALFEFRAEHPEISLRQPEMTAAMGSPMATLNAEMERANTEMKRCYGGVAEPAPKKKDGPACRRLRELERGRDDVLSRVTENHPEAIAAIGEVKKAQGACDREQDASDPIKAGMSPEECVAAVRGKISRLNEQKLALEKGASKKPKLERKWAELNLEASALDTEWIALKETYRKTVKERLLAANEFKDSFVLVDPPRVPELPSYPDQRQFMMIGMMLTFVVGLGIAILREALRQTFVEAREVEEQTGLPVLASLPPITDE